MKIIHDIIPSPRYAYFMPEEQTGVTFFDIETTGLSPKASSLYLIGAMHFDTKTSQWKLTQWFANDYHSEKEILCAFLQYLKNYRTLCHFNGNNFDIPYILDKCTKYNLTLPDYCQNLFHGTGSVDILKEIRPLKKKLHLVKANQTSLEHWLNIHREDTMNGGELIPVYAEYMQKTILQKEGTKELEKLLLLHNHDDLAGLLEVTSLLAYRDALSCVTAASPVESRISGQSLQITFNLTHPVPRNVTMTHSFPKPATEQQTQPDFALPADAMLFLDENTAHLTLPVYTGELKFFFSNYKDYYYLPLEDTAIHKSVAEFVDKNYRKKATAATCYIKKEGNFLPSLSKTPLEDIPSFYSYHKSKLPYYQLPDDPEERNTLLNRYLIHTLKDF